MIDIIIFGTGLASQEISKFLTEKVNLVAYVDNNSSKWNSLFSGKKIISPKELLNRNFDYIIVASSFYQEIEKQLLDMKIVHEQIINYCNSDLLYNLHICNEQLKILLNQKNIIKKIDSNLILNQKNLMLNAKIMIDRLMSKEFINNIQEAEFKVFSQWGEDGIIQYLINTIDVENKFFVEFGVEDYTESNTRFLLCNNNWNGFVMDGSLKNVEYIKNDDIYWQHNFEAKCEFITKENINNLIKENCPFKNIGILSIDIDGVDYWVWKEINCINPAIVICEYNGIFGDQLKVTVPYDKNFYRTDKHYSNLYWGASLKAFIELGKEKGYQFIGGNSAGNNAFFVKNEYYSKVKNKIINIKYSLSKYRESRDKSGKLNYLSGNERLKEIQEMELFDLENNNIKKIKEIYGL